MNDSSKCVTKIMRGAGNIWSLITQIARERVLHQLVSLILAIISAIFVKPSFWWIWFPLFPAYMILGKHIRNKARAYEKDVRELYEESDKRLYDGVGNVKAVKSFAQTEAETLNYARIWSGRHNCEMFELKLWGLRSQFVDCACTIMRLLLIGLCANEILQGTMTLGTMTLLLTYQESMNGPLGYLESLSINVNRSCRLIRPMMDIAALRNTIDDDPAIDTSVTIGELKKKVRVDDICFSYDDASLYYINNSVSDGSRFEEELYTKEEIAKREKKKEEERKLMLEMVQKNRDVLSGVSFDIKRGSTFAIVGRSGAGKSTLIKTLLRFYNPTSGQIRWNGTDIRTICDGPIREQICLVPQDTSLFNRSIKENIMYGCPDATEQQVISAAKQANAHKFILESKDGYNSLIGERGVKLSGGQRQRIAIARALLKKPSLLIFDECTSSLDAESELAIQEGIKNLSASGEVTQVIIAHRLSTVLHANNIMVLDKGSVIDVGSHQDLYKRCALYQKFVDLQFKTAQAKKKESTN
eukprot:TRINITY_DN7876_c0_g1_i1.p1 TRINITY_DN7876_c0_g1~~TRINITY_DN7876_c0_g1_i1.p1  ORF type:complete len:595 (-),score=66.03 TRINITY_DN7876_c0_g1_i1:142-1725(-)